MEPPCKNPKLSISEAADILIQLEQPSNGPSNTSTDNQVDGNQTELPLVANLNGAAPDFSQEEKEENSQIQASLPHYFDHVFGTCIGQSQSQCRLSKASSHMIQSTQSQYSIPPQASLGFSVSGTDTRLLDSQGFIFNSSSPGSLPAPPPSTPPLDTAAVTKSPTIFLKTSPANSVFSSPSSTSSSPSTRSNRSPGTPILFRSPSRSPELATTISNNIKAQQIHDNKTTESLTIVPPSSSSSSSHVENNKTSSPVHISQGTSAMGSKHCPLYQDVTRKRKLNFDSVTTCLTNKVKYSCPPTCTLLSNCTDIHKTVSVFAIVLQVNPVMEVACKAGLKAGYKVPMSSLLLGDPTKSYFKLSLWREAAVWVERISAGDVVLFKNIKLRSWQREVVGTTIMYSSVLNLHQPNKQLPDKVREVIPFDSLESLLQWGRKTYGYLFGNPSLQTKSQKPVNFSSSGDFGKESLIHFRAKLLSLISNRVVLIADEPGGEVYLYLLCVDASLWYSQLSRGVGQVWEFMYIAVTPDGATQGGGYSLQTTSCSFLRPLQEDCQQATDILTKFPGNISGSSFVSKGCTVADITSSRLSGVVEVEAVAVSAWFLLSDGTRLELSQALSVANENMLSQLCQAVYVGCESCSIALQQDANGVYCQCLQCMLKKPGGYPSSAYYFRPMVFTLQDSTGLVVVSANHAVVPKVLCVTASEIVKASLAQSEEFGRVGETLRQSWQLLQGSATESSTRWIVNCTMSKDENSFLEAICFTLLDILLL